MTMKQLTDRLAALEAEVSQLKARLNKSPQSKSWAETDERDKDDPVAAEIARLTQEIREEDRRRTLEEFDREEAQEKQRPKKKTSRKINARA